jgi:predicted transcriptional regulator
MYHELGEAAGEVWRYLNQNGPTSFANLNKNLELNKNTIDRAIGWLARERKIQEVQKGKNTFLEALE